MACKSYDENQNHKLWGVILHTESLLRKISDWGGGGRGGGKGEGRRGEGAGDKQPKNKKTDTSIRLHHRQFDAWYFHIVKSEGNHEHRHGPRRSFPPVLFSRTIN